MKQALRSAFALTVFIMALALTGAYGQTKSMGSKRPAPYTKNAQGRTVPNMGNAKAAPEAQPAAADGPRNLILFASDNDKASVVAMDEIKNFPGMSISPLQGRGFYLVKADKPETLTRIKAAYPELHFFKGMELYNLSESLQQNPEMAKAVQQFAEQP